jgi:hypothetical protein
MVARTIYLHSDRERAEAQRMVAEAPAYSSVVLRPPKRTLDQNALMWVTLDHISRAKPEGRCHTPDVWKALFMHAAGHAVQFEMGLDGHPFPLGFSSSRLDRAQMRDLLDFMFAWASQRGVVFPADMRGRE